jgi:hypothetical protein
MLKRDELNDPQSCLSRAHDDEMTFVLLARDPAAPVAVRAWLAERVRLGLNRLGDLEINEAEAIASIMDVARELIRSRRPRN